MNLALMDFPVDRVKDHLFKSIDRAPMSAILKVHTTQVLLTYKARTDEFVALGSLNISVPGVPLTMLVIPPCFISPLRRLMHKNTVKPDGCTFVSQALTVLKTTLSSGEIAALSEAAQAQASKIALTSRATQSGTDANRVEDRLDVASVRRRGRKNSRICRDGHRSNFGKPFMHPVPPAGEKSKYSHLKLENLSLAGIMGRDTDEVRMTWESGVGDKKGQRHQIQRARTVSTRFGPNSVGTYRDMVGSALSLKMETFVAASRTPDEVLSEAPPQRAVVGVISYTEELSKNVVRSGVPPPLPKYTRVAMWRGDDVCLEQIGAGDVEELVAGITWCEPKGFDGRVDLDLSVIVSNSNRSRKRWVGSSRIT